MMAQKETKKINVCLTPEVLKKLEDGNYNKNKLIVKLLEEYLSKDKK